MQMCSFNNPYDPNGPYDLPQHIYFQRNLSILSATSQSCVRMEKFRPTKFEEALAQWIICYRNDRKYGAIYELYLINSPLKRKNHARTVRA